MNFSKTCQEFEFYHRASNIQFPAVSVILSTYNRCRKEGACESLLKRAIQSILNQTFKNFELILIDDCSIDGTEEYCKEVALKDPRVHFYHFKKNSGLPAIRYNFGISQSKSPYLTFMFDDDEWNLTALEDLYAAMQKAPKHCGMAYGLADIYYGNDRNKPALLGETWGWRKIDTYNFIANLSVIVKREAIDLVGGYDEDPVFSRICDWDLWWRIGRKFRVVRIEKKIGILNSQLSDSIELNRVFDPELYRKKQKSSRLLPLRKNLKEPLRCKVQTLLFDMSAFIFPLSKWKILLKKVLPIPMYRILQKTNAYLKE